MTTLSGAQILLPSGDWCEGAVTLEQGRIETVETGPASPRRPDTMDLDGGYLVPGLFDIQVNGGGGVLFNDAPTLETLRTMSEAHRAFGTCAMLPTLISDDIEKVRVAIAAVEQAMAEGVPGIVGIHLEGPMLNPAKRGIHDARHFRTFDAETLELFSSMQGGRTLITLAPEAVERDHIRELARRGIRVALGHSLAGYDEARIAEADGITGYTHLFNAMTGIESRKPGAVVAALEGQAWCGLIVDGHHVDPAVLRLAIRAKADQRFCLVTDAMPVAGTDLEEFVLGGRRIVIQDGACRGEDGTLAGSALTMIGAVHRATESLGIDLASALRFASMEPARFMGLEGELGTVEAGRRANLLHLDADLRVQRSWIDGDMVEVPA
ncbi:MAG: N-acetylglucosamine-6-phosphate deacetylase [Erythrobacter sp.]|uniref:N-acetylglucosamine-6-phosphate deacetylase n=1 Tax=Erythrobacter sp. TaxID=1042 RepID=UPI001B2F0FFF|nr:N-acetylglucosamine-6-phosphate deacetylase [Erythrobacter sp.]MBO6767663.1 N-acetylglucosamine-6-phosphate deacetylase [Erythrobacter sp.]